MNLAQKIVISVIVIIIVVVVGGTILGGVSGVRQMSTNGSRMYGPGGIPSSVESPFAREEIAEAPATGTAETKEAADTADTTSRLVIKTGEINMVVKDVTGNAKRIIQYAQDRGGWVVQSNIQEIETLPMANIVIRVPVKNFDEAITYIRGLATKVNYEKSEGQDVTEEYVDLESRLKNLEATEKQFLVIMKKAKTIEEILRVQSEISRIRGQIEQAKGRMLYLERSSKMATITVNLALSEDLLPIPPSEKWRPGYVAKSAWKGVVAFWRSVSYAVINFFVFAVVWVPIAVIVCLIVRQIRRPRKAKK